MQSGLWPRQAVVPLREVPSFWRVLHPIVPTPMLGADCGLYKRARPPGASVAPMRSLGEHVLCRGEQCVRCIRGRVAHLASHHVEGGQFLVCVATVLQPAPSSPPPGGLPGSFRHRGDQRRRAGESALLCVCRPQRRQRGTTAAVPGRVRSVHVHLGQAARASIASLCGREHNNFLTNNPMSLYL